MLLAPPLAEPPPTYLRVHVTAHPHASAHLAVTPAHADRLIAAGLAVAVTNQAPDDLSRWLDITASATPRERTSHRPGAERRKGIW